MPCPASSLTPEPALPATQAGRLTPRLAFVLQGSLVMSFLAASTAPSPLYGLYREMWGFSALTLTFIFAVYAFALLGGLLVFGALSDHIGRRPVLLSALVLELGSIAIFLLADGVGWLVAARLLQGLATGIATATLSAGLLDVDRERGGLVNSVAPMLGMAFGALFASALVQFARHPIGWIFEGLALILVLQTIAACFMPETALRRPGAWRSLKPRLAVPSQAWPTLLLILPVNTALWALGGFYVSLGPTLARSVSGHAYPLLGGGLIATLVISGSVGIMRYRLRAANRALGGAAAGLIAGLAITLLGVFTHSTTLLFLGTVIAGLGFGAGFYASVRSLVPLAPPEQRGAMMSAFYVLSYLAFSVPALAAGTAVGRFGIENAAYGYAAVLIALAAVAGIKILAGARSRPSARAGAQDE